MGNCHLNMGCGGGDDSGEHVEVREEVHEEPCECRESFVKVWVTGDADSPNFLIRMWCADWMTIRHVKVRCNQILKALESWGGDDEFVVALAPQWGDGWEVFDDDANLWEVDGWDGDDEEQAMVAITEDLGPDYWGGHDFCEDEGDMTVIVTCREPCERF